MGGKEVVFSFLSFLLVLAEPFMNTDELLESPNIELFAL